MVDVTLLELNLESAEFSANAPFSGSEGDSGSGSTVSKLLKRSSKSSKSSSSSSSSSSSPLASDEDESSDSVDLDVGTDEADGDSSTPIAPLVVLGALVVFFAAFRKLRGRDSREEQQELVEYEA